MAGLTPNQAIDGLLSFSLLFELFIGTCFSKSPPNEHSFPTKTRDLVKISSDYHRFSPHPLPMKVLNVHNFHGNGSWAV